MIIIISQFTPKTIVDLNNCNFIDNLYATHNTLL